MNSMIFFTDRNNLRFNMPKKYPKWGFKLYFLVDSNTNYLYNIIFGPGKDYINLIYFEKNNTFTESIVLRLLEGLEGKQRRLFCDMWYSSISLIGKLN